MNKLLFVLQRRKIRCILTKLIRNANIYKEIFHYLEVETNQRFINKLFYLFLMIKKSHRPFGGDNGLIGKIEETDVHAEVGGITNDPNLKVGLSARQIRNLGCKYGPVFVKLYGTEKLIPVKVYNAFGTDHLKKSEIWISRGLAEKTGLKQGGMLRLYRYLDEQGRIKYKCENQTDNPFGRERYEIKQPAEGIIAAIDDDGHNSELYRIGLSVRQMFNLNIHRKSEPLNNETIMRVINANEKGLLDSQDYGNLIIEFKDKKKIAEVYNAGGTKAMSGCCIRISSILAEDLGLTLDDRVKLYTT